LDSGLFANKFLGRTGRLGLTQGSTGIEKDALKCSGKGEGTMN
jgi:hypothetical protein